MQFKSNILLWLLWAIILPQAGPPPVQASIDDLEKRHLGSVNVLAVGPKYSPDVNPFAVAAELHAQATVWSHVRGTPYILEVRDQLQAYMKAIAPYERPLEEIVSKPGVHTSNRPMSYEDGLLRTVLIATLGTGK